MEILLDHTELADLALTMWNVVSRDHIRVTGLRISKSGKFLLKLRAHHSGKFAPWEINPLYGNIPKKFYRSLTKQNWMCSKLDVLTRLVFAQTVTY